MIASKWMKWTAATILAAAFPAAAMGHTHKTVSPLITPTTAPAAKIYSVTHKKAHKLHSKHRSGKRLHANAKRAKSLHSRHHSATKLHSKKKTAAAM